MAPARFQGRVLHNGVLTDFTAEVHPPEPLDHGEWGCRAASSLYEVRSPIRSGWPEHAYELAFAFLRNLLDHRGEGKPVDLAGTPLLIRAPVYPRRT